MKKLLLISVHLLTAGILLSVACSDHPVNQLKGHWISADGKINLEVTDNTFAVGENQVAEDYFVKDDTIYTSFEGNQPYTKYTISTLNSNHLTLINPDSEAIDFNRR